MRRARIVSGVVTSALVAGVLVATSPTAAADVGDITPFSLPAGSGDARAIGASTTDLWVGFGGSAGLARVTPDGVASLINVTGMPAKAYVGGVTQDTAGRVWFTELTSNALWSINRDGGDPRRVDLPNASSQLGGISLGPDGNLWFAEYAGRVGRITPAGALSEFVVGSGPAGNFTGLQPIYVVPGTKEWLAVAGGNGPPTSSAVGRITTAGNLTEIPSNKAISSFLGGSPAATPDGDIYVTSNNVKQLVRVTAGDARTAIPLSVQPWNVLATPDGAVWFNYRPNGGGGGPMGIGRYQPGESAKLFDSSAKPDDLALGPDGNVWVTTDGKQVLRVLSGITPASTAAPAVSSPAGSANGTGTVLTATNGSWTFQPTTFAQQWQRCTSNDAGTCTDIPGANKPTYTVTDTDLGGFVRATITATNLNGAGKPASSSLFQVAAKPAAPVQPTTPTPVAGGATVTIAPGVTAKLTGPSSVKRKAKRTYRATFTAPQPRGTVRFSLLDKAGTEVYVLTENAGVKGGKKTATAARTARIPRSVAKGTYTLRAIYTPAANQTATYPVATLTRGLRVR